MTVEGIRVSSEWLDLREPADADARALDLVEHLRRHLPATGRRVIHDLGCGTGAMGRWLAPLLPGPQHWVVHDRDTDLLRTAAANPPGPAADGASVGIEARRSDITLLGPDDLAGATLITASALLDLMTGDQLARLVDVCAKAGCPALLTLSVVGRVDLAPAHPLDRRVTAAFDAHQRRLTAGGRLLGPDAVPAAVEGFRRLGGRRVRAGGRAGGRGRRLCRPASGGGTSRAAGGHRGPRRPAGHAMNTRVADETAGLAPTYRWT